MAAENRRDSGNQNWLQRNSSWLERHFSYIRPHSGKSLLETRYFFDVVESKIHSATVIFPNILKYFFKGRLLSGSGLKQAF